MKICAFDVETANEKPSSICSIGIYLVDDGKIIESRYDLVRPKPFDFNYRNTRIHHLTANDVAEVKTFSELWKEISWYFEDSILVAHNAGFDVKCVESILALEGIKMPSAKIADTVLMSRVLWPDLENHKLNTCAKALNAQFEHHHALEDAWVSALIAIEMMKRENTLDLEEVYKRQGWNMHYIDEHGYHGSPKSNRSSKITIVVPEQIDESSYFFQKKICFTTKLSIPRKEAMQAVANGGGFIMDSVDEMTDLLVVNDTTYADIETKANTSKLKTALKYKRLGAPIEIIGETMFKSMY